MKRKNILQHPLWIGLLGLLTVIASGWVGDAFKGECLFEPWLGACGGSSLLLLCRGLLALALFGVSVWLLYLVAKNWVPVRHLAQADTRPHRVLIAAISGFPTKPPAAGEPWIVTGRDEKGHETHVTLKGVLQEDIDAFTKAKFRWNGQQFLRALALHLSDPALEHLVLIGSPSERGSFAHLASTQALARLYTSARIHLHPQPIDFESIEALQETFKYWIEHFRDQGVPEKDIIIDVTGGQKTTSIAAALTTLRWDRVEFQYVQTGGDHPRVISYNVVIRQSGQALGS